MRELDAGLIAAGLALGLGALVVLHLLPTGLSPLRNAVSQYGITPYRAGYRVQTMSYGIAGLAAAAGIASLPGPNTLAVALCVVFGVSRLVISWFPMDPPGGERSVTGRRHGLLAICAFCGVGLAADALARLLLHNHNHPAVSTASEVLALAMVVDLVAMAASRRATVPCFGLIERGFYALMTGWLVLVALLLVSTA